MADFHTVASSKITLVEFNDEQKANVAAALQALADEIGPVKTRAEEEVIELSDSDDAADELDECNDLLEVKPSLKLEIKEEEPVLKQETDSEYNMVPTTINGVGLSFTAEEKVASDVNALMPKCILSVPSSNTVLPTPSTATYITMSDITQDVVKVEEVDVQQLLTEEDLYDDDSMHSLEIKAEDIDFYTDSDEVIEMTNDDDASMDAILIDSNVSDDEEEQLLIACGESTDTKFAHKPTNAIEDLIDYRCPVCNVKCGTYSNWKIHTEREHQFGTIAALNMKTIINKVGKLCYQCGDCQKKYDIQQQFSRLLKHRCTHLPFRFFFVCKLCNQKYGSKYGIRLHLFKSHKFRCEKHPNIGLKYLRISCPFCDQPQPNHHEWFKHLNREHDYTATAKSRVKHLANAVYTCNICNGKILARSIVSHMLKHESKKSFTCTECNHQAIHVRVALCHVQREHLMKGKGRMWTCCYCDAKFSKSQERLHHYKTAHRGKLQKCPVCDKEFLNISLLMAHMNMFSHHKLK